MNDLQSNYGSRHLRQYFLITPFTSLQWSGFTIGHFPVTAFICPQLVILLRSPALRNTQSLQSSSLVSNAVLLSDWLTHTGPAFYWLYKNTELGCHWLTQTELNSDWSVV